jgi:hypothetical protein
MTVYEPQFTLLDTMPSLIAEWGWQDESCPETGRLHRQGYFRTARQMRFSQAKDLLPGVHIEQARDWNKLLNYCKKKDTSLGNRVHETNENKHMTMCDALTALAQFHKQNIYNQEDDRGSPIAITPQDLREEYWHCVRKYLQQTDNGNAIGLFTNNQIIGAWINTRSYWISRYNKMLGDCIDATPSSQESQEQTPPQESQE